MFLGSEAMMRPPVATGVADHDDGSSVGKYSAGRGALSDGS